MMRIRLGITESGYRPAPAGDGCSDELLGGPFSQPSPASAGIGCLIKLLGGDLERR